MKDFLVKLIKNPYVLNLLLAVVVACALVFGTLKWLDSYTRHNEAVVVPDVKGLGLEEAAEFFKNSNLRYNVIDSVFSKDVKPGAIVELVPMAGSKVKEGRIVFVTVNALTSQMATNPGSGRSLVPAGLRHSTCPRFRENRDRICPRRF